MRCNAYFTHHVISCGQVPHILRRHSPCMHMGHFRQVQNLTAKDVAFCKDERHERAMRRSPGKSDCRFCKRPVFEGTGLCSGTRLVRCLALGRWRRGLERPEA